MSALNAFLESNARDKKANLPNSPMNNNPWFYCALAVKIITEFDGFDPMTLNWFRLNVVNQLKKCECEIFEDNEYITKKGLYNRWPDNGGGPMSQDELIGIAYLDQDAAFNIVRYIFEHDGIYINKAIDWGLRKHLEETQDMYRFYWLDPYLRTCAKMKVSFLSQFKYGVYLFFDMVFTKKNTMDASGRLLKYVTNDKMKVHPLAKFFINLWNWRMNKLEITPKLMLTLEPKENPVFADYAPMRWK
jgi:hypothetical protein